MKKKPEKTYVDCIQMYYLRLFIFCLRSKYYHNRAILMYGMLIKKCPIKRNGSILQFATQISYNFSKHNSLKNWREIQNDRKNYIPLEFHLENKLTTQDNRRLFLEWQIHHFECYKCKAKMQWFETQEGLVQLLNTEKKITKIFHYKEILVMLSRYIL